MQNICFISDSYNAARNYSAHLSSLEQSGGDASSAEIVHNQKEQASVLRRKKGRSTSHQSVKSMLPPPSHYLGLVTDTTAVNPIQNHSESSENSSESDAGEEGPGPGLKRESIITTKP